MALDTFSSLCSAVLNFIGRPGDPAVAPFVPDMVRLFEAEAYRRLKNAGAETVSFINTVAGTGSYDLPPGCSQVRAAVIYGAGLTQGAPLEYLPATDRAILEGSGSSGHPRWYTIVGFTIGVRPVPDAAYVIVLDYMKNFNGLSEFYPSNWLLFSHPDAYLFGTLVEAEAFIGNDERAPLWLQRRDAAFASIEQADRKARWPGGLQIRPDIWDLGGGGGSGGGGGVSAAPSPLPAGVRVVSPISGAIVTMNAGDDAMLVTSGPLAALTILLPPTTAEREIEISFAAPVTALVVQDSAGTTVPTAPTSAYGPGAALVFRWVTGIGFQLWK